MNTSLILPPSTLPRPPLISSFPPLLPSDPLNPLPPPHIPNFRPFLPLHLSFLLLIYLHYPVGLASFISTFIAPFWNPFTGCVVVSQFLTGGRGFGLDAFFAGKFLPGCFGLGCREGLGVEKELVSGYR